MKLKQEGIARAPQSSAPRIYPPFAAQAQFYDIIYADKPYQDEAKQLLALIERFRPGCRKLLSIGSGTCRYEIEFAKAGIQVSAVDQCSAMLEVAQRRVHQEGVESMVSLHCERGEVVTFNDSFDAVVLLFCVVNYCHSPEQLYELLANCCAHLKPGGLVIFDSWHKPAASLSPPTSKESKFNFNATNFSRTVTPTPLEEPGTFLLEYRFEQNSTFSQSTDAVNESHRIRAFSADEIEACARRFGAEIRVSYQWPTLTELHNDSWTGLWVLQKGVGPCE